MDLESSRKVHNQILFPAFTLLGRIRICTGLPSAFRNSRVIVLGVQEVLLTLYRRLSGAGYLDDVSLVTARQGPGTPARWVEQCTCPLGYEGRRCERCAPGYRRANPLLGSFSACEACNCNGHSDACDPSTGRLILQNSYKHASKWELF